MRNTLFVGPVVLTLTFAGLHCSSSSGSGGGSDAGVVDSSTADSGGSSDSGSVDSGADTAVALNGCTDADLAANDQSDADAGMRTITFPTTSAPAQYTPHCMKIKVGQSVTWSGDFTSHPLEAMGGDPGNPIMLAMTGMTATTTFPAAGKFGFDCANHPSIMHGVILVVP